MVETWVSCVAQIPSQGASGILDVRPTELPTPRLLHPELGGCLFLPSPAGVIFTVAKLWKASTALRPYQNVRISTYHKDLGVSVCHACHSEEQLVLVGRSCSIWSLSEPHADVDVSFLHLHHTNGLGYEKRKPPGPAKPTMIQLSFGLS
jgi:hypothetical protein